MIIKLDFRVHFEKKNQEIQNSFLNRAGYQTSTFIGPIQLFHYHQVLKNALSLDTKFEYLSCLNNFY